jgi:peptidoglycan/xylan/chitin deacetylase (PgdA/CDA1 family)
MSNLYYYQHARCDQKKIALTFDDGPNPLFTRKVLEILAAKRVRGTFFMIGNQVATERTVVEEVLAAGHVIGNHTYTHAQPWENHGTQFWLDELDHAEQVLRGILPRPTAFFRMPFGFFTPDVNDALRTWIGNRRILNGGVAANDWAHLLEKPLLPQTIIDNVFSNPALGPGAVIVFHDGSDKPQQRGWRPEPMVSVLPMIIDTLQAQGYELVGVDEMDFDISGAIPLA